MNPNNQNQQQDLQNPLPGVGQSQESMGVTQHIQAGMGGQAQPSMGQAVVLAANQIPPQFVGLMANQGLGGSMFPAMMAGGATAANFLAMQQDPNAFAARQSLMISGMTALQGADATQQMGAANALIAPMTSVNMMGQANQSLPLPPMSGDHSGGSTSQRAPKHKRTEMTAEDRARQNRDRNREHARSTRLRKKAYVQKLKELVEGLHAERTEEVRQRRVAVQHLSEVQNVRRSVVRSVLKFFTTYETDSRKWGTILEDDCWLKQPVTPFRSFRRAEIEKECRMTRGIEAMICEAASLSVMIECIGSRSQRWMQIKRDEFIQLLESKQGNHKLPRCVIRQDAKFQHAISSLSSSSGSSNHASSSSGEEKKNPRKASRHVVGGSTAGSAARQAIEASVTEPSSCTNKVSSSSGSNSSNTGDTKGATSNDFHDYHAKPLPDPKLGDSDSPPDDSNDSSNGNGKVSTDSSSGDDSAAAVVAARPSKRRKHDNEGHANSSGSVLLPSNIAKQGGIPHNIQPSGGSSRLDTAPAIPLPPFSGIGKRRAQALHGSSVGETVPTGNGTADAPAVVSADPETSSSSSNGKVPQIRGSFHINEDDMILMENVLMCPFIFRSQDAVVCGALTDCVMPGMLRAQFSPRNKIAGLELVYDAMGFMQQLERSSGNDGTAQIIPGSLEMALSPTSTEARVITTAQEPFLIVNVNEPWTRTTGYTQMEVEGAEYLNLLTGEATLQAARERSNKPCHKLEEVAKGRAACSTNVHYDKQGRDYIDFVCSFPLTNANDEITHILHVSKELALEKHDSATNRNSVRQ